MTEAEVSPRLGTGWALVLVVLAALGPWVPSFTAQTSSRYGYAAAVVDDGTTRIDRFEPILGADDFVERDGHLYTDKAPLQPMVAVPLYGATRLVGGEPAAALRTEENLSAWWVNLWTGVVPMAALAALMFRAARQAGQRAACAAALALSFGTILPVLTTSMYGHTLSALLGFAAWLTARAGPRSPAHLVGAGALVGAAVATEYTLAIVGLVLLGWLWSRGARTQLLWFVLGGLPFVGLLAAHQAGSAGSPWRSAYSSKAAFEGSSSTVVGLPDLGTGLATLVGSRGVLLLTPVVAVALVGCVRLIRRKQHADQAVVALVVFAGLWLVHAGWPNPWGGEVPGPRYLAPALPFLAVPLASLWPRHRRLVVVTAAVGTAVMGFGVLVSHIVGHGGGVLASYTANLREQGVNPTVWTIVLGPAGWLVFGATVVAAVWALRRSFVPGMPAGTAEEDPEVSRPRAAPA